MGTANLSREKVPKSEFVDVCLALHKKISKDLYSDFRKIFQYKDEFDGLIAFNEIEYSVFWFFKLLLDDAILPELYAVFLEGSNLTNDVFAEQLAIRYKIYDKALIEFTEGTSEDTTVAGRGLDFGNILVKVLKNLDLLKNGSLGNTQSHDVKELLLVFVTFIEKMIVLNNTFDSSRRQCQIDQFLKKDIEYIIFNFNQLLEN